ncbi:hypothetical protein GC197_06855 [bacterium]|nr:hypothetical protein [bacterium]
MNWLRKHWGKLLSAAGVLLVGLIALIAAAPMLIGYGPVRNFILHQLFNGKEVAVSIDSVSVGWFQPTEIEGLHVKQIDGKFNVGVPRIANNVTLFQLITRPRQLGNLVIERPLIALELPDESSDVFNDVAGEKHSVDQAELQSALDRTIDVEVVGATLEVHKPGAEKPWGFKDIGFLAQLRPGRTDAEGPSLLIPRATLMDQQELTQEMCDDMLKFVAPIVTGVTKVDGKVSLSLEDIEVPLADRQNSVGKGTLTIHKAQLTGTPLVQEITKVLGLGPSVEVFTDCTIQFHLKDKQIYHEGLDFGIGNLRIKTHGYVGLDKSLNLIAEVPIPLKDSAEVDPEQKPSPLLDALRGKTIEIPIVGTLDKPEVDAQRLGKSLMATAQSTLRKLLGDDKLQLDPTNPDGKVDVNEVLDLTQALINGATREGGLMDQIRQRREAKQAQQNEGNATGPSEEPAKPGLFRRLIQRVQDAANAPDSSEGQPPPAEPSKEESTGAIDL